GPPVMARRDLALGQQHAVEVTDAVSQSLRFRALLVRNALLLPGLRLRGAGAETLFVAKGPLLVRPAALTFRPVALPLGVLARAVRPVALLRDPAAVQQAHAAGHQREQEQQRQAH